jgi:chemotaxis protein MotB
MFKKNGLALTLAIAAVGVLAAGCCGDVEAKLNKCNKNLKETLAQLDGAQSKAAGLERLLKGTREKLKDAKAENEMLTKRLEALGQDVAALKRKGEMSAEEKAQLAQQLAQVKKQMAELKKRQQQAEARAQQFRNLLKQFEAMIKAGKVKVTIRDGRLVVQLPEKILFPSGRARLKKDGEKAIAAVTQILKQVPNRKFQVTGHTDNVPIRSRRFKSNWELSTARAVNVVKSMQKEGLNPKRLSAAGYSQYSPVAKNDTPEGRAQNRRIEIVLMPNLSELPSLKGVLDSGN